jgi:hypothetical protein
MLDFIRSIRVQPGLILRRPGLALAFLIAELFYKFHSFALECLGFLVTWLVIDLAAEAIAGVAARLRGAPTDRA